MPASKFLKQVSGALVEEAPATDGGVPNANRIPALDDNGRLTAGMMPNGIVADNVVLQCTEALADGDWVNIYNVAGVGKCRKADATTAGKEAHGYVLAAYANGANVTIWFEGLNDHVTGQTPGNVFLSTTAGVGAAAPPAGAGNIVQKLGVAVGPTAVNVGISQPITLA